MAKLKPLIIVESPAKAKTIHRFLGNRFQVKASLGHVRDLPKSQFGVDIEHGFQPRYITIRGKGPLIKELKEAAKKTDTIYLATDPDREGEAIAWHLAEILGVPIDSSRRIEFHEITKDAVSHAIKHARPIDMSRVNAQQARRILDRVVGYQLSPLLWRKVRPGLSAGRVQSTALRLLVEREDAILAFEPEEYYTVQIRATLDDAVILAGYAGPLGEKGKVSRAESESIAVAVRGASATVQSVRERERNSFPPLPFTTSTLQQEASRRLGFTVRRTMSLAQQLYEGLEVAGEGTIGLISYIRTDSTRIAETAREEAQIYIREQYGPSSVGEGKARGAKKVRPGVQDAHEAIRPTAVMRHPETLKSSLNRDQLRLYRLIWTRFVASQMAPARFLVKTVELGVQGHQFRASLSRLVFAGYQEIYQEVSEEEVPADATEALSLPPVNEGDILSVADIMPEQHFTEPPPRFSEASLVKMLEELGIGRPSTYAPTIETLLSRNYIVREQRRLIPTELGRVVVELLRQYFPEIVDSQFTAEVENQLDRVESDALDWHGVLSHFYGPFAEELARAEEDIGRVELPEETTDEVCTRCERPMVVKHGRFGKFLACSGYPECEFTKPFLEKTGGFCPRCGADLVVRKTRRGRTFYGCSAYPQCDFVTWNRPSDRTCPRCGTSMAYKRRGQQEGLVCLKEGCGYEEERAL